MSEPFLAEIRIFGFNFPPRGWAQCDGQILPIEQNQSLFALLGIIYGGDGRTTFALPELRGRTPIHFGSSGGSTFTQGQKGGEDQHPLSIEEIPQHTHVLKASSKDGDAPVPTGFVLARSTNQPYISPSRQTLGDLASGSVANAGNGQGHNTMQPFLTLNFCIALQGVFPPRN